MLTNIIASMVAILGLGLGAAMISASADISDLTNAGILGILGSACCLFGFGMAYLVSRRIRGKNLSEP